MQTKEKKYKVEDFDNILKLLNEKGAEKVEEKTTTHFYAEVPGNDVVKLVSTKDKNEIHIWKEKDGTFTMTDNISLVSKEEGMKWLADHGYKKVGVVKMQNTDYKYKNGLVGLYTINDWLKSVILDFPEGEHEKYEKEFGIEKDGIIALPYNKYLEELGRLEKL